MEPFDNTENYMTRTERHAAALQQQRAKKQAVHKKVFLASKLVAVLLIALACVTYLIDMPGSSSYFTSQGQSEPHSIAIGGMQPLTVEEREPEAAENFQDASGLLEEEQFLPNEQETDSSGSIEEEDSEATETAEEE